MGELFVHIDNNIKGITLRVLETEADHEELQRKIAKECFRQATIPAGILRPDHYLTRLGIVSQNCRTKVIMLLAASLTQTAARMR